MSRAQSRRKKRLRVTLSVLLVVVLALGGAGVYVWAQFGEQIAIELGWTSNDYEGEGQGETVIAIVPGEIGEDIAATLESEGVVKTAEAFYELLLAQDPAVEFLPGFYNMRLKMSSEAALQALQDPANRVDLSLTVPEGMAAADIYVRASELTGIPVEDFERVAADYTALGVPADFPSIEGFLFPATYSLEPGETAESLLQRMVDRMWQAMDEHAVPEADVFEVITLASIIQREAGSNPDDFYKISRVFTNRLEIGMRLQSDATVAYGTGRTDTVWTNEEERLDKNNPYSTYANDGLPIGPIGNPGDLAIDAAVNPAVGDWLFFVPINLETGETVFSNTEAEHEAAKQLLFEWCETHAAEGGTRCD